jgi:hypothetical protein
MSGSNYNELSQEYDKLFLNNIHDFINKSIKKENIDVEYNIFYPSFGVKNDERCDFLFYGQACNGWPINFNVNGNPDAGMLNELMLKCKSYSNEFYDDGKQKHNPLDWVNVCWSKSSYCKSNAELDDKEYYEKIPCRIFTSFFWNVIYKTISDYYNYDRNSWHWSSKMVWSNLYKIAPLPPKRNPNDVERSLQKELSVQLVKKEIEEINPRYCIVLTNDEWWKPFQSALNPTEMQMTGFSEIETVQNYKNSYIIVTTRPWKNGNEKHVSQILEVIKKLD